MKGLGVSIKLFILPDTVFSRLPAPVISCLSRILESYQLLLLQIFLWFLFFSEPDIPIRHVTSFVVVPYFLGNVSFFSSFVFPLCFPVW